MNIYVSGGSKCGKSEFAENTAMDLSKEKQLPLYYVATMRPKDQEDMKRIEKHQISRQHKGFETLELKEPQDFESVLKKRTFSVPFSRQANDQLPVQLPGVFLVDSVTALLENTIFDEEYNVAENAWKEVTGSLKIFMEVAENVVFVSDFVYSDGIEYDSVTETYRKNLAMCDRVLAEKCDQVYQVINGCPVQWK